MVGITYLLVFFLISGEGRNRVKTLAWEALLKMAISLVLKLGHMLVSSGEFWGKKALMPKTYPRDADLIGMVCGLDMWSFKNSPGDFNTQARWKYTDRADFTL